MLLVASIHPPKAMCTTAQLTAPQARSWPYLGQRAIAWGTNGRAPYTPEEEHNTPFASAGESGGDPVSVSLAPGAHRLRSSSVVHCAIATASIKVSVGENAMEISARRTMRYLGRQQCRSAAAVHPTPL